MDGISGFLFGLAVMSFVFIPLLRLEVKAKDMYRKQVMELEHKTIGLYAALQVERRASRRTANVFDDQEYKTLLSLCHPDKHNGKASAVRMTQKILDLRGGER